MNRGQLECFLRVAKAGSITKAAEELFLSQPSVTYQVSSLEKETGQRLFERGPRGTRLTEVGQQLVPMAARIVADMQAVDDYLASLKAGRHETVTVLHYQIVHDRLWRSLLADYAQARPDVEVRTVFGTFRRKSDWPQADVYIVPQLRLESFYPPGTEHAVLYRAWVHGIMSAGHPLAARDYIDLESMNPYPMIFPSFDLTDLLGCWYWMLLRDELESHILEFHNGLTLQEIPLELFNSPGVFLSQGIHTGLAPGLVQVPFTPESPRVDEHVCWRADADQHVIDFVGYLRRYYAVRPEAFGNAREVAGPD